MSQEALEGFNIEALTLRVQAIERWRDVEQRLTARGFTLGWAPPLSEAGTLGELLEARAIGLRSALYGDIAANCIAVEAVLADGQPVRSKVVPRSAAGPDWKHVLLGGQGLTGRISTAVLRVHPLPAAVAPLAWEIATPAHAIRAMGSLLHRGAIPAVAVVVPAPGGYRLLVTFEGHPPLVQARADIASRTCAEVGGRALGEGPTLEWLAGVEIHSGMTGAVKQVESPLLLRPALRMEGSWAALPAMVQAVKAVTATGFCVTHLRHAAAALLVEGGRLEPDALQALARRLETLGGRQMLSGPAEGPVGRRLVGAFEASSEKGRIA